MAKHTKTAPRTLFDCQIDALRLDRLHLLVLPDRLHPSRPNAAAAAALLDPVGVVGVCGGSMGLQIAYVVGYCLSRRPSAPSSPIKQRPHDTHLSLLTFMQTKYIWRIDLEIWERECTDPMRSHTKIQGESGPLRRGRYWRVILLVVRS